MQHAQRNNLLSENAKASLQAALEAKQQNIHLNVSPKTSALPNPTIPSTQSHARQNSVEDESIVRQLKRPRLEAEHSTGGSNATAFAVCRQLAVSLGGLVLSGVF